MRASRPHSFYTVVRVARRTFRLARNVDAEGTGLPIVKEIVEAAGGRIGIEPARGAGSTFRLTWPVAPAALPAGV